MFSSFLGKIFDETSSLPGLMLPPRKVNAHVSESNPSCKW